MPDHLFSAEMSPSLSSAVEAAQAGDAAQAIRLASEAAVLPNASAEAHFFLGSLYAAQGNVHEAEAGFANALLIAPDWLIVRYQLGLLYFSSGRAALALLIWQPLKALPPTAPYPNLVSGFDALARKDFVWAQACFEAGLALLGTESSLAPDVHRIIAAVASAPENYGAAISGALQSAKVEAKSSETFDASDALHVLISNYQRPH